MANLPSIYSLPVRRGDTVGLVLPSSMITAETLDQVLAAIDGLGLKYKLGRTMQRVVKMFTAQQDGTIDQLWPQLIAAERTEYQTRVASGYMAGEPQGRAQDINDFFADDEVDAIWCLRGGFSSSQIMPYLDYDLIRRHPKQIIGHSDITNVIAGIHRQTGLVTYHAPMIAPNWTKPALLLDGGVDPYTKRYFEQFVMSDWSTVKLANPTGIPLQTMSPGSATAPIVGGNLTELASAVGTPYATDPTGKIVFLEEVRTHIVTCDLALTQLENSGFFDHVRGVILGDFLDCHNRTGNDKCQDWLAPQLLHNHFANKPYPVLAGLKLGHDRQTVTIPLGATCQLDADHQSILIRR